MQPIWTERLKVEYLHLAIADLPPHLDYTRLVQLSDLHYDGQHLSDQLLMQAIAASNEAEPDFVVITGDFVTDDPAPIHDLAARLKHLQAPAGIYGVLGNHDLCHRSSRSTITDVLHQVGIQILWNQTTYPIEGLALVGLPDYWAADYKYIGPVLDAIAPTTPRIVLAHNPDAAARLHPWRVDLQLSGHSHGGQIILPLIGNVSHRAAQAYRYLPKRLRRKLPLLTACYRVMQHWEWAKGFHHVGNNRLYVNRGLRTYFPGRLFCPPEVTVITLKCE